MSNECFKFRLISEKFGKTTITERPIVTESNKIIKVDLVIFNISKNFKILYLNLP